MLRTRWSQWLAIPLVLGLASPAVAEESALGLIPENAPLVIHVHGLERAKARLLALVKNSLPKEAAQVVETQVEKALKDALKGRALKGLAADGPIFLTFLEVPGPERNPLMAAILVRVKDYAEFRDNFLTEKERQALKKDPAGYEATKIDGVETYWARLGEYAVVAFHKEAARRLTKGEVGLDKKLGKKTAAKFLQADLAAYVDMRAVNKEYGTEIKASREVVRQLLSFGVRARPGDKTAEEIAKGVCDLLFQALSDCQNALVYVELRPDGLAVHAQTRIGAGTTTNSLLKSFQPSALDDVGRLPQGQMGYSAMVIEPALLKTFPSWLYGVSTDPKSPAYKTVQGAIRDLVEAGPRTRMSASRLVGQLQETQVWTYDDPAKAVTARLHILKALQPGDVFQGVILKAKPDVKPDAQTHRGVTLHYARLSWDIDGMIPFANEKELPKDVKAQAVKSFKHLLGDGIQIWFGTDGKVFVQIAAKNWETARHQLDQYLDNKRTAGREQGFHETRQRLPARTTVLLLVEMSAYAQMAGELMAPVLAQLGSKDGATSPQNDAQAKPRRPVAVAMRLKPSFLGMAFTLQRGRGSLDFWVPADAIRAYYTMLEPFFKVFALKAAVSEAER